MANARKHRRRQKLGTVMRAGLSRRILREFLSRAIRSMQPAANSATAFPPPKKRRTDAGNRHRMPIPPCYRTAEWSNEIHSGKLRLDWVRTLSAGPEKTKVIAVLFVTATNTLW